MTVWVFERMSVPAARIVSAEHSLAVLNQGVGHRVCLVVAEGINIPAGCHVQTEVHGSRCQSAHDRDATDERARRNGEDLSLEFLQGQGILSSISWSFLSSVTVASHSR